ncbi:PD-(D/E)XK nuclease family protein [Pedobacter metabolipauper]|uniref:CorA-like Mg2+ transporter protein n=1 Tax=Pedobacter metabolipauper TaxID=425513 RepID=A0A4R6STH1_9SPHI|nr:hypothetical protein [Pedobacter metabolipauper]TDQ07175.1 hypothetical protein ATK78_4192 [Pedobacter metabolipauper]
MVFNVNSTSYLTFVGPFRTQLFINSQKLIASGYVDVQKSLSEKLNPASENGWQYSPNQSRSSKLSFDVDTYQGLTITPRYLIAFNYQPDDALKQKIKELTTTVSTEIEIKLKGICLKYMDSGAGTISFNTEYILKANKSAVELKEFHEQLSSKLSETANDLIIEYTAKLKAALLERDLLIDEDNDNQPALAWMHRIFYVKTDDCNNSDIAGISSSFISKLDDDGLIDASIVDGIHFYPSIGNSLVIYTDSGLDSNMHFRALESMIEYINCNWLSMSEMDKKLFFQINKLSIKTHILKLKDLEKEYNHINNTFERITLFKSILFNHKINLSPQDYRIWECISKTWKLEELISAVTTKSETLKSMNQGVLERLQTKQNNKLNYLVFMFTTISFVTIILQVIEFVQQDVNVPNILRSLTVIFLTIMVAFSVKRLRNWFLG